MQVSLLEPATQKPEAKCNSLFERGEGAVSSTGAPSGKRYREYSVQRLIQKLQRYPDREEVVQQVIAFLWWVDEGEPLPPSVIIARKMEALRREEEI